MNHHHFTTELCDAASSVFLVPITHPLLSFAAAVPAGVLLSKQGTRDLARCCRAPSGGPWSLQGLCFKSGVPETRLWSSSQADADAAGGSSSPCPWNSSPLLTAGLKGGLEATQLRSTELVVSLLDLENCLASATNENSSVNFGRGLSFAWCSRSQTTKPQAQRQPRYNKHTTTVCGGKEGK